MNNRFFSTILITIFLSGCVYFVSWSDVVGSWVGRDVAELTSSWGEPDEIEGKGNKKIYIYRLKGVDPTCIHYWFVDEKGTITGFKYKGRCRPIG